MKAAYENNQIICRIILIHVVSKEGFFTHKLNEKREETLSKIQKFRKIKALLVLSILARFLRYNHFLKITVTSILIWSTEYEKMRKNAAKRSRQYAKIQRRLSSNERTLTRGGHTHNMTQQTDTHILTGGGDAPTM